MRVRGFTMIEIMVVMVIIGLLATLGGASYTRSIGRGRDARRIEDMKSVQKGFEMYYSRYEGYNLEGDSCQAMFTDSASIFPEKKPPTDPLPGRSYVYTCTKSAGTYCACASLENGTDYGNSGSDACDFSATPKTYFCVQNVQ